MLERIKSREFINKYQQRYKKNEQVINPHSISHNCYCLRVLLWFFS